MIGRILRVLVGLIVTYLAAGLTLVLFVYTPAELASSMAGDRMSEAGLLALAVATHSAVFSAPLALIAVIVGEGQEIGSIVFYVLMGVVIATIGFLAQFWGEVGVDASIINSYAVLAFLVTGMVAGAVYWLLAGRFAAAPVPREPARPAAASVA
jgi:hypothetical protein